MVFYEDITRWIDDSKAVDVVSDMDVVTDFSKEFDTASHSILAAKLRKCGLDDWVVR